MDARPPRRGRFFSALSLVGVAVGVGSFALTLTPSLLPRTWAMQGVITGIIFAVAYGLGVLTAWAVRRLTGWEPTPRTRHFAWIVLLLAGAAWVLVFVAWGAAWQNETRRLVGVSEVGYLFLLKSVPVAAVIGLGLIALGRALRALTTAIGAVFGKQMPRWLAFTLGGVAVALGVLVVLVAGFQGLERMSDRLYGAANDKTDRGVTRPQSAMRSGSPASLVGWRSLGRQGRSFVAGGPSRQQLTAFNGRPPKEPIRVYVGVESAPTAEARAALAVRELERTGAFTRRLLVVMGSTSTGRIEPQSADPPEYMYNGDTAEVSIQYSVLPSWIGFIRDEARAADAGRALFGAVYAAWSRLPAVARPRLIAYGLGLGSLADQAPFVGAADLRAQTDGALFAGTPNDALLWRRLEAARDAGSPEWLPVYKKGRTIRWAAGPQDLAQPSGPWESPRVAFLQHGSDPVVWWSLSLVLQRPGWLREPRARDVSEATMWLPLVTFLQITADKFAGTTVAKGHGRDYRDMSVYAWAAVASPPGWTTQQTTELQTTVDHSRAE